MCGRYTQTVGMELIREAFGIDGELPDGAPRFNIAPTQWAPVIRLEEGRRRLVMMQWGLVPSWSKDPGIGAKMINARAETLQEKPSFRTAFRQRRCLIPADGFYEWYQPPGSKKKIPIRFVRKDRKMFAFAGLWESWRQPDGTPLLSYTIITAAPNELLAKYHHRMAVILAPEDHDRWLDPLNRDSEGLMPLLCPSPAEELEAYPVSTGVNSPANDRPEIIEPQPDLLEGLL